MNARPAPFSTLAGQVARAQDRVLTDLDLLPDAKRGFLKRALVRSSRSRWELAACALGGAIAAGVLVGVLSNRAIRFETQSLQRSDGDGALVAGQSGQGKVVFSDGSTVVAGPNTRLRIESLTARGASVRVESGALRASIVHQKSTQWSFHAGPFEISVLGTRFDVDWNARDSALSIKLDEGSIRVSGCSAANVVMPAGQQMELRCVDGQARITLGSPQTPGAAASGGEPVPSSRADSTVSVPTTLPSRAAPEPEAAPTPSALMVEADKPDAASPDWRAMIAAGHLRDAYAAADGVGFEQVCAAASGRELLDLSDAALMAGRADRATQALLAVRKRFAGSAASAAAAYKLGRIAFDNRGAMGDARTWFLAYLQEAPGGALAREASGRLIEIDVSTGNVAGARERAREYLRNYPDGPHAKLAKGLVQP